ncbi:DUF2946 family protein [Rugamonas sp. FT82W]|uniref:DUF2946 family protein n=1 Tax=Duganella vulcania TaxID=2692166 RepID=A0A845FZC6_9BURK|nr:DUF2946 family protein [Duganella vulcania]MYM86582.1 DUF2946 family protein [Duganella vulcania]
MDDIVKQALAKWPNVPYCYGWLGLDARGNWRMRDERAQHLNLPGDKLHHAALVAFIVRNYAADERGCWYFQNGPQRVYVRLEATPYIVRTDPALGWLLHTGAALGAVEEAVLTETGALVLRSGGAVAQLDDRDFAHVLPRLKMNGDAVADETLLAWIEGAVSGALTLDGVAVQRADAAELPARFGYVSEPSAPAQ